MGFGSFYFRANPRPASQKRQMAGLAGLLLDLHYTGAKMQKKNSRMRRYGSFALVEHTGFEPVTSTLPVWHSSQLS